MKFPTPPPVRKPLSPKAVQATTPAAERLARLAYAVSVIFWMAVMSLVGAAFVWLILWPLIRHVGNALVWAVALNVCIGLYGYVVGMWSAQMILSEVVKNARRRIPAMPTV